MLDVYLILPLLLSCISLDSKVVKTLKPSDVYSFVLSIFVFFSPWTIYAVVITMGSWTKAMLNKGKIWEFMCTFLLKAPMQQEEQIQVLWAGYHKEVHAPRY